METASYRLEASTAFRRFLDHYEFARHVSPHTVRAYAGDLADFSEFLGRGAELTSVDRDTIRAYARALRVVRELKETTIRRRLATLKVLFRWLEREGLSSTEPIQRLDVSVRLPRRLPRALPTAELRQLLHTTELAYRSAEKPDRFDALLTHFVVVTLLTTGLRVGELVAVRKGDVTAEFGAIQVRGKGNRERRVYASGGQALATLERYLAARLTITATHDALLCTRTGGTVTADHVRRRLSRAAIRAHIERWVTPHMLRHSAATQLIEAGVDIRFVQQLLGHASIATTQIYTQVSDPSLRERLSTANTIGRITEGFHDN
jgi:integrase/recombinase XerD